MQPCSVITSEFNRSIAQAGTTLPSFRLHNIFAPLFMKLFGFFISFVLKILHFQEESRSFQRTYKQQTWLMHIFTSESKRNKPAKISHQNLNGPSDLQIRNESTAC